MMSTTVEASGTRIKNGSTTTRAKEPHLQVLTPITCNHNSRKMKVVYMQVVGGWGGDDCMMPLCTFSEEYLTVTATAEAH